MHSSQRKRFLTSRATCRRAVWRVDSGGASNPELQSIQFNAVHVIVHAAVFRDLSGRQSGQTIFPPVAGVVPARSRSWHEAGIRHAHRLRRPYVRPRLLEECCCRLPCSPSASRAQKLACRSACRGFTSACRARRGEALLPQWRLVNGLWGLFLSFGLLFTSLLVRQV